jgi:hypothetical protein
MDDGLRTSLSVWLTLALDSSHPDTPFDDDLHALRDWIDGGCAGDMPTPRGSRS